MNAHPAGSIGVAPQRESPDAAMIILIVDDEPLGRETLAALLGPLGLHGIFGQCDPRNTVSARVLERIGMRYEGHLRETMLIRDGWPASLSRKRSLSLTRTAAGRFAACRLRGHRVRPLLPESPCAHRTGEPVFPRDCLRQR